MWYGRKKKLGKRIVDVQGDYYALCPYASRVPFEVGCCTGGTTIIRKPRAGANRHHLAALLEEFCGGWRSFRRRTI